MRILESAMPVEAHRLPAVTSSDKHSMAGVFITAGEIFHHKPSEPFMLTEWGDSEILQFAYTAAFNRNDCDCKKCLCLFV